MIYYISLILFKIAWFTIIIPMFLIYVIACFLPFKDSLKDDMAYYIYIIAVRLIRVYGDAMLISETKKYIIKAFDESEQQEDKDRMLCLAVAWHELAKSSK